MQVEKLNSLLDSVGLGEYHVAVMPLNVLRVYAVDPATVAAIIEAAVSALEKRDLKNWQSDVSSKLDRIIEKLDEILIAIARAQAFTDWRMSEETRRILYSGINATRIQVDQIMAGLNGRKPNNEDRERLVKFLDDIGKETLQLADHRKFGFTYFHGVLMGVCTSLQLQALLGIKHGEVAKFAQNMVDKYLLPALDVNLSNSIAAGLNNATALAIKKKGDFDYVLNKWWLGNYSGRGGRVGRDEAGVLPTYDYWEFLVTGDLSGINHQRKRHSSSKAPDIPWFPDLPEKYDMGDGPDKAWYYMSQLVEARRHNANDAIAKVVLLQSYVGELTNVKERLSGLASAHSGLLMDSSTDLETSPEIVPSK